MDDTRIANDWRRLLLSPEPWHATENQAGVLGSRDDGEAGGYFAASTFLPDRRAYLKPTILETGLHRDRAAREKIASDLAHRLDVIVPPVLLWERPSEHRASHAPEANSVCLSLVLSRKQLPWGTVEPLLEAGRFPPELADQLTVPMKRCGTALAFDYWLGQPDHDHPSNIMYGYGTEGQTGDYIFLDYAFALGSGSRWRHKRWKTDFAVGFPGLILERIDRSLLAEAISQIEQYPEPEIESIVGRIPEAFLPTPERDIIMEALIERRHLVRSALNPILQGTR